MKMFSLLAVSLVMLVLLQSCAPVQTDYLMYQSYPFTVEADCTFKGDKSKLEITVSGQGEGRIKYVEPERLNELTYDVYSGNITVGYGNLSIPIAFVGGQLNPIRIIDMFCLSRETLSKVDIVKLNGVLLNHAVYDSVSVYITSDGIPMRIENSDGIVLDIKKIY